jgi:hypothetical protein
VRPLNPHTLALLRQLLSVPGLDSGRPFLPSEVLPRLPRSFRHLRRSGRTAAVQALERRGLVGRTADGRYYLTPAAVLLGPVLSPVEVTP